MTILRPALVLVMFASAAAGGDAAQQRVNPNSTV
jgi:hypothetical protein